MSNTDDYYRDVFGQLKTLIPWDLIWNSSVLLLIQRGQTLSVQGSGTLLRIADQSYLITATHVIEESKDHNLLIVTSAMTGYGETLPLAGACLLGDQRLTDVAAIRLSQDIVDRLDDKLFARLTTFGDSLDLSDAAFAVVGHPELWAYEDKEGHHLAPYHHIATTYKGLASSLENYKRERHFLIGADPLQMRDLDGTLLEFSYRDGPSAPFPKELKGLSGASVWIIAEASDGFLSAGPDNVRIVGVVTSVYQNSKCIRATLWREVLGMLWDADIDLRPAIDLWRGTWPPNEKSAK